MKSTYIFSIGKAFIWTGLYFLLLLIIGAIDIAVWRKIAGKSSVWFNLATMIIVSTAFFYVLVRSTDFKIGLTSNISAAGILSAIGCAIMFYILLDKCLDPFFESLFPMSEAEYKNTINSLRQSPVSSFIRVCLIAPVIEEILMRGVVLSGLRGQYGIAASLVISSVLFALLHFNMVQTLSAFICGLVLGILYLKTDSIFCCILAHVLYNAISYFAMIYPAK